MQRYLSTVTFPNRQRNLRFETTFIFFFYTQFIPSCFSEGASDTFHTSSKRKACKVVRILGKMMIQILAEGQENKYSSLQTSKKL